MKKATKSKPAPAPFSPAALVAASPEVPARDADAILPPQQVDSARVAALQKRLERDVKTLGIKTPVKGDLVRRKIFDREGRAIQPEVISLGDRTVLPKATWRRIVHANDAQNTAAIPPSLKAKLDNEADLLNSYWGWIGVIEPEYDLLEPWTLLDVESYYKQSIDRRLSLAFRNGFEVTGNNQAFVKYIDRRFDQIGFMMEKSFESFLREILWNLNVCSNCIVIKIRDEASSGGQANDKNGNKPPIASYKILPPQTIYPWLDGKGRIEKWRRFFGNGRPYRDYAPEDVMHFCWDRKPGHLFGTPRSATVRDDIFALRRLEENVELLLVNHLFPLFHVKVGTPEAPAQQLPNGLSEIDVIKRLIQDMPKEGVFVSDERVEIEVHGAAGEGVDPNPLLEHYKGRVISGLGMSPLDLGIADTSNRGTADNVSQNLKDTIIADLKIFSDQVSMLILRDLFSESSTQLSVQRATNDVSLQWHEIDVDTQIKKETHAVNKFNNNAITRTEMRSHLKLKPLEKEQQPDTTHEILTMSQKKFDAKQQKDMANLTHEQTLELQKNDQKHDAKVQAAANDTKAKVETHKAAATKTTKVTRKFANGGSHSKQTTEPTSHAKKAVATILQPQNQHGKNLDPHKARSSEDPELAGQVFDLLCQVAPGQEAALIDELLPGDELQAARERLKVFIEGVEDMDVLWTSVDAWAENPLGEEKIAA